MLSDLKINLLGVCCVLMLVCCLVRTSVVEAKFTQTCLVYYVTEINEAEVVKLAKFDVLVGINLLREGLDLPEVSLVAILDADKEGFLRSAQALIQTSGRAARNAAGKVIYYADTLTKSIQKAMAETERRRKRQLEYNEEHGITPESIRKTREEILQATSFADSKTVVDDDIDKPDYFVSMSYEDQVNFLAKAMKKAAENLEFESDELSRIDAILK